MYPQELRKRIADLEEKIKNRDAMIANLIEKNNSEKLRLEKMKLNLQAKISEGQLQRAKVRPKSPKAEKRTIEFLSLSDCENMGLHNRIVLFPVARCKLHNCYLDFNDVRKRNCVFRMCKHMEWVTEESVK